MKKLLDLVEVLDTELKNMFIGSLGALICIGFTDIVFEGFLRPELSMIALLVSIMLLGSIVGLYWNLNCILQGKEF